MSPETAKAADSTNEQICTQSIVPTPAGTCPRPTLAVSVIMVRSRVWIDDSICHDRKILHGKIFRVEFVEFCRIRSKLSVSYIICHENARVVTNKLRRPPNKSAAALLCIVSEHFERFSVGNEKLSPKRGCRGAWSVI